MKDIKVLKSTLKPEFIRDRDRNLLYFNLWNSRVLPYFDLKTWFQINNQRTTNSKYGQLLWPESINEEIDLSERVKKTIRKYYKKVFMDDFLNSLS